MDRDSGALVRTVGGEVDRHRLLFIGGVGKIAAFNGKLGAANTAQKGSPLKYGSECKAYIII